MAIRAESLAVREGIEMSLPGVAGEEGGSRD
jgi:hypothetical protein